MKADDLTEEELNQQFPEENRIIEFGTGKPILHRQSIKFGCCSFALANLFDNPDYLNGLTDVGERNVDLNLKLSIHQKEMFLGVLFWVDPRLKEGRLTDVNIFSDFYAINSFSAFLMTFYKPSMKLNHTVLICQDHDIDRILVLDSTKENIQIFHPQDLIDHYWIVGIEYFGVWQHSPTQGTVFNKSQFEHIF